jgi:hypothetical protein
MKSLASAGDRQEIADRLGRLRPDSTRQWGRMSVDQMVRHVADAYLMALGEKRVAPRTGLLQSTVVKWMALYLPKPWPTGLATVPEIDRVHLCEPCGDLASSIAEAIGLVERMHAVRGRTWPRHPIFGRMSEGDWLRWGYLHTDHHLRQFSN